jgi:hypothetical protein
MSALTLLSGDGPLLLDDLAQTGVPSFLTTAVMDASTEKLAIVGCVWHPTVKTGTINIRKVHFRVGALTFNAASTIRVSLQNVSATAGPPYQPDGSQDQIYDFASGAGLTANAWNATGNLSADRTVSMSATNIADANSRWVAVVFEFQAFTAADSLVLSAMSANSGNGALEHLIGGSMLLNTGSWAIANCQASVVALECDDGSFAFLTGSRPVSAISSATIGSGSAIRAAGMKFRFPMEVQIDAIGLMLTVQNGADGDLILYDSDGTTVLASVAVDNDAVFSTAARVAVGQIPAITLAANTYYRLVFVSSTATTATMNYVEVNTAALMDGFVGGQNFHWTQRDSGGTWTDTTTRRPLFAMKLCSVHDGTGGGGGNTYSRGRIVNP